jgi:lysophospholipase L1-like esterase
MIRMIKGCLVASIFILTACDPEVGFVVGLLGDSLSHYASRQVEYKLVTQDNGAMLIPNSISGAAIRDAELYWASRLESIQDHVTLDYLFISLGTNDVNRSPAPAVSDILDSIDLIMAAVDPGVEVYWILPMGSIKPALMPVVMDGINQSAALYSNLQTLSFEDWLVAEGVPLSVAISPDGIHHTEMGHVHFANMIQETLVPGSGATR